MYPYRIQHYGVPYCKLCGVNIKQGVKCLKATVYNSYGH